MAETIWTIKGREFAHCNCAYGCPCQFNAVPTHGDCRALLGIEVEKGHHGNTKLDGLRFAAVFSWPGPVHEGRGEAVFIIDERSNSAQRDALLRIVSGQDTEPGATFFQVFASTLEKVHEPVFTKIDFEVDIDSRKARLNIDGMVVARGEPILNPVTGKEHRARFDLPDGFEYLVAEAGRGWANVTGPISFQLADSHAHFADLHIGRNGVVRDR
ncbi:MAG TPA: DUF1326 domain-containing protein [Methylocella sp.]|nr:DUF1326 domain-containing protein [Methylocella sp.]